jgi:hypothetical protein
MGLRQSEILYAHSSIFFTQISKGGYLRQRAENGGGKIENGEE